MKPTNLSARLANLEQQQSGPSTLGVVIIPNGMPSVEWPTYIEARAAALCGRGGLIVIPAKGGRTEH